MFELFLSVGTLCYYMHLKRYNCKHEYRNYVINLVLFFHNQN